MNRGLFWRLQTWLSPSYTWIVIRLSLIKMAFFRCLPLHKFKIGSLWWKYGIKKIFLSETISKLWLKCFSNKCQFFVSTGNPRWLPPQVIILAQAHIYIHFLSETINLVDPKLFMIYHWMISYKCKLLCVDNTFCETATRSELFFKIRNLNRCTGITVSKAPRYIT
jgi:hypothetical protein